MLSGKDITIDKDGSIILNGDKYPLASQAEIDVVKGDIDDLGDTIGDITQTGVTGADVAAQITALDAALTAHDNTTVQQLNIFKSGNMVYIYGYINNLSSSDTVIAYATLDEKYKPASNYAIGTFISATAPYLPVGSVWISKSAGAVHIYKDAATTEGYVCLAYMA